MARFLRVLFEKYIILYRLKNKIYFSPLLYNIYTKRIEMEILISLEFSILFYFFQIYSSSCSSYFILFLYFSTYVECCVEFYEIRDRVNE